MRVLVIPEDFRKDQQILKPIIMAMMKKVGKPHASVKVCQRPLLGGVEQALKWERIEEIIHLYRGMIDLFLLCIDRDGKSGRKVALEKLEEQAAGILNPGKLFLAENAWQEIEVWVLAGQRDLPPEWSWQDIRQEINPKETYFFPYAQRRNLVGGSGKSLKILAEEAASRYDRLSQLCPEDIANLENRIAAWI